MTKTNTYIMTGFIGIFVIIGTIFITSINYTLDQLLGWNYFFRSGAGLFTMQLMFYAPLLYTLYHSKIATEQLRYVVLLFLLRAIAYLLFMLPLMNGMTGFYALMNLFFDFAFVIVFIMVFNQQDLSMIARALLIVYALLSVRSLLIFEQWFTIIVWFRHLSFIIGMTLLVYQVLMTDKAQPSEFI